MSLAVNTTSSGNMRASVLNVSVNRDDWKRKVADRHPEIQRLRESIQPWERFRSVVELYEPGREQIKQQLHHDVVVQVVLQHLSYLGFYEARELLVKESGIDLLEEEEEAAQESLLLHYIRRAYRETEQIYSLTMDSTLETQDSEHNFELEDLLCSLELMEAEPLIDERDNINIWDEPAEGNLSLDADGMIKCATLNKLVELISSQRTEMSLVQTFLTTYQSFATPELLFSKLLERFTVPDRIPDAEATLIQMKVGNVLRKWIESCIGDFSPDLMSRLNIFIKDLGYNENKTLASLSRTLRNAIVKAEKQGQASKVRQFNQTTPPPKINMKNIFDPNLDILTIHEEELARQICIIDFRLFSKIKPSEFLNQAWSKPKYKHRAVNVLRMINRFNTVSMWVASSILKVVNIKPRAKLMAKFIRMGDLLMNTYHNFNATMAILAGLNWASVHRLNWTRKELPPSTIKTLEELERALSSEKSFLTYRTMLAEVNPPAIPYLGVYLTDLTFMDENSDIINGQINFAKRRLIYGVISKIQQYQQTHYNLQPVEQIIQQLLQVTVLDESTMYSLSLKREPRKMDRSEIK